MNWDQIAGNWKQFKGHVKEKWGKLTDDDLDVIEGKRTNSSADYRSGMATPRKQAAKGTQDLGLN